VLGQRERARRPLGIELIPQPVGMLEPPEGSGPRLSQRRRRRQGGSLRTVWHGPAQDVFTVVPERLEDVDQRRNCGRAFSAGGHVGRHVARVVWSPANSCSGHQGIQPVGTGASCRSHEFREFAICPPSWTITNRHFSTDLTHGPEVALRDYERCENETQRRAGVRSAGRPPC